MEEKNFKNYKFMVPMYGWPIDLYYGKASDVKEYVENKWGVCFDNFDGYCNGYTSIMGKLCKNHKELNMFFFISSETEKFSPESGVNGIHTIHHEAIHCAWFILDYVGVHISEENHEALTYLEGYIAKTVHNKILQWKK